MSAAAGRAALIVGALLASCGERPSSAAPTAPSTNLSKAAERAGASWSIDEVPLPAAPGALAPRLTDLAHSQALGLSWIERGDAGAARVLAASCVPADGGAWSEQRVLADSEQLFVNWADVPGFWAQGRFAEVLGEVGDFQDPRWEQAPTLGLWLAGLPAGGYAYHVQQTLGGAPAARLHRDDSATEHGFVSAASRLTDDALGLQVFWLDGHAAGGGHGSDGNGDEENGDDEHGHGGAMALHTAFASAAGIADERTLDARVCDCCGTAAATTPGGPLVAYRDRSDDEVRDIALVRWTPEGWTEPATVAEDGWRIAGCPVNGPAVATSGPRVAVAWSTGAPTPRVRLAVSLDEGRSFGAPLDVLAVEADTGTTPDGERPLGRPALRFDAAGDLHLIHLVELPALGRGSWRLERFAAPASDGQPWVRADRRELCPTSPDRDAGFPTLAGTADQGWLRTGRAREMFAVVRDASAAPARLRGFWIDPAPE